MQDSVYCYPNSDVLINKLNITDAKELFEAETQLTAIRLRELQEDPLDGDFDFKYLKKIHKYIFDDIYAWAGKTRTVELGKGNLFCTTACINDYADAIFAKYKKECFENKDSIENFIVVFAKHYGDLNALHPFREGNDRTQREFARLVCLKCGYNFDLSCTTHKAMLKASKLSFDKGDNSLLIEIFKEAVKPLDGINENNDQVLSILTADDLFVGFDEEDGYYDYYETSEATKYNAIYKEKIDSLNSV